MAYKLMNKRNENVKLNELEPNIKSYVEMIQQGEYIIATSWDEIEKLFEIFPNNEEWEIERLSNKLFAVLPNNTSTFQRNEFKKLLAE